MRQVPLFSHFTGEAGNQGRGRGLVQGHTARARQSQNVHVGGNWPAEAVLRTKYVQTLCTQISWPQ